MDASATLEEHLPDLQSVFNRLTAHWIVIDSNKRLFGVSELDLLGHHINQHGVTSLPEIVQAIRNFCQPQS